MWRAVFILRLCSRWRQLNSLSLNHSTDKIISHHILSTWVNSITWWNLSTKCIKPITTGKWFFRSNCIHCVILCVFLSCAGWPILRVRLQQRSSCSPIHQVFWPVVSVLWNVWSKQLRALHWNNHLCWPIQYVDTKFIQFISGSSAALWHRLSFAGFSTGFLITYCCNKCCPFCQKIHWFYETIKSSELLLAKWIVFVAIVNIPSTNKFFRSHISAHKPLQF